MGLYTLSGYDSAGQLGEETENPEVSCPKGILDSIMYSILSSFFFILITLYFLGDTSDAYLNDLINSDNLLYLVFKK